MMINGCVPALITPMQADGRLCLESFARLIKWHERIGTKAVIILGSTGESTSLTAQERDELVGCAFSAKKNMQIWVGATAPNTKESQQYVLRAKALGADGVLVAAPPYVKPTNKGLIYHYQTLANLDIPVLMYNHPGRTGTDILPEVVFELKSHPNIVGIKETGDISRITHYQDDNFSTFCGDDGQLKQALSFGAVGSITVVGNIVPQLVQQYITVRTEQLWNKLENLQQTLACQTNPIPVKWAMNKLGMIPEGLRLPLCQLEKEFHSGIEKALHEVIDEKDFVNNIVPV